MYTSPEEMDAIIKQASLAGRLWRGAKGATGGALKGSLVGGLLGTGVSLATGSTLPMALGTAGGGLMSGALVGGGVRGTIGGLRGLLSSSGRKASKQLKNYYNTPTPSMGAGMSPLLPLAGGAGLGYLVAGDDSKLLGTGLGAAAGLLARPSIMRAMARRRGVA